MSIPLGKKDKGIVVSGRDCYIRQLMWISTRYFLLQDVRDRRGWLVDGARTLLHLTRASIRHLKENEHSRSLCLFNESSILEDTASNFEQRAAISHLAEEDNMRQPIFQNPIEEWEEETIDDSGNKILTTKKVKYSYHRFSDQVQHIYRVLEQLIDHQHASATEDGVAIKSRKAKYRHLEGWEYSDIIEDKDPLLPRYNTLAQSEGWVQLVTEIRAVVLFGDGFGDLITPAQGQKMCAKWASIPKGMDYLAIDSKLMKQLMEEGDQQKRPWRLHDLYWHSPNMTFEPCRCKSIPPHTCCDRVQVLLPVHSFRSWAQKLRSPAYLNEEGALIFGQSKRFTIQAESQSDQAGTASESSEVTEDASAVSKNDAGASTAATSNENTSQVHVEDWFTITDTQQSTPLSNRTHNHVAPRPIILRSFREMHRRIRRMLNRPTTVLQ